MCFQIQKDITYKADKEQLHKQRENTGQIEQEQFFWTAFRTQPVRLPAGYLGQISHDFLISSNSCSSFNDTEWLECWVQMTIGKDVEVVVMT